jgi:hypothetical protein
LEDDDMTCIFRMCQRQGCAGWLPSAKLCRRLFPWTGVEAACADAPNLLSSAQDLTVGTLARSCSACRIRYEITIYCTVIIYRQNYLGVYDTGYILIYASPLSR